ncbi:Transcriptional regulatory protein LiaR [bacterium HR17]|jgi:DNA-binding NarL/FixJ family response regulator|uniref:Transcriptional regulatory protein LiaR n=1 Tax=Candidatus Fervidibacter japonicus TaxID=2035412 RepID=A0A2H5XAK4_9BACT|nr:Transcriptional regulatory protein LiaR [bacterium HR17]
MQTQERTRTRLPSRPHQLLTALRVLIADSCPLFLLGLKTFLEQQEGIELVGTAREGEEVLRLAQQTRPSLVIVDLAIARPNNFRVIRQVRNLCGAKVLVVAHYTSPEYLAGAIQAGALGYLFKESDPYLFLLAIRTVQEGRPWIQREFTEGLFRLISQPLPPPQLLTARERDILALLAQGLSNKEIAYRLGIKPGTVKEHISRVLRKLNLRNRTEAAVYATQFDLQFNRNR